MFGGCDEEDELVMSLLKSVHLLLTIGERQPICAAVVVAACSFMDEVHIMGGSRGHVFRTF